MTKAMTAGKLRTRAFLQQPSRGIAPDGGKTTSPWGSAGEVCIAIRPASGRELQLADAQQALVTHVVLMRDEIDGMKPTWRFVLEGGVRCLNIVSILHVDEVGLDLKIMCEEVILEEPIVCE